MGSTAASESLVGIFAAMAGILLLRRRNPKLIELAVWSGLVIVCFLAVTRSHDAQARALTSALVWAVGQMIGSVVGSLGHGAFRWTDGTRLVIADWAVLLFGAAALALTLVRARRQAEGWQPAVKLRDWIEMPRTARPKPAPAPAVEMINRRLRVWASTAAGAVVGGTAPAATWLHVVPIPRMSWASRASAASVSIAPRQRAGLRDEPTRTPAPSPERGAGDETAAELSVVPRRRKSRAHHLPDSTGAVAPASARRNGGMGKRVTRKRDRGDRLAS